MSKAKRLISILLAAVMLATTLTIGVSAQYYDYKDTSILATQGLDSQDKPILTVAQYSSMILDEVDRMLKEQNINLNMEVSVLTIKLDARSVDSIINDLQVLISTVNKIVQTLGATVLGDLSNINFNAVTLYEKDTNPAGIPLRTTQGKTDMDILKSLLKFLADNAGILAKVIDGSLNAGALSDVLDLSEINIPQMAKGAVYELVHPDEEAPENVTDTIDSMLQTVINSFVDGTYDTDSESYQEIIAEYGPILQKIKPYLNISSSSVTAYEVIKQLIKIAYNDFAVPFFNTGDGNKMIREMCGVTYDDSDPDDPGDESKLNTFADIFNIDFVLQPIDFDSYYARLGATGFLAEGYTIFDCLNDILGQVVEQVFNPELGVEWDYSLDDEDLPYSNYYLKDNIVGIGKLILKATGDEFFADGIAVLTPAQIDAMSNAQTVAYVLRSILNASFDNVIIPDTADNICSVLNYAAMYLVGESVPEAFDRNGSGDYYPDMDKTKVDTLLEVAGDYLAFVIMRYLNVDTIVDYSDTFNEVMSKLGQWAVDTYGGLFSDITWNTSNTNAGWRTINSIFFKIIPINWIGRDDANRQRNDLYKIFRNDILTNLVNLDFYNLLSLFRRNLDSTSELNKPLNYMLVNRVFSIINYIFPGAVSATNIFNNFEDVVNPVKLKTLVNDLIVSLSNSSAKFLPALLPIAAQVLDLSKAQEFGYPEVGIDEYVKLAVTEKPTFTVYNGSSGINTGRTTINPTTGALKAVIDGLYKYEIVSTSCKLDGVNNSSISVTRYTDSTYKTVLNDNNINGGTFGYYQINGLTSAMNNKLLHIIVKYNIKDENAANMTTEPLQLDLYTFIAQADDDSDVPSNASQQGNMHTVFYNASYLGKGATLANLENIEFNLKRKAASSESGTTSYQHEANAVVNISAATLATGFGKGTDNVPYVTSNAAWSATTNKNGADVDFNPYLVSAAGKTTRPADGVYSSDFEITMGATKAGNPTTKATLTHKVYFYDDYGFYDAFESAAESNRQQANYGKGNYNYTYENELGVEVTETVNGTTAWANYQVALENAASVALRPRQIGSFRTTHADRFESLKDALTDSIARLEACAVSSGVSGISAALLAFRPEQNDELEYWENGYVYWEREDYVDFTYRNFREEANDAEDLVSDAAAGKSIDSVEATYVLHRLNLYGGRLIRVRANTSALRYEVEQAQAMNYNQADYFADSWADYQTALTFANEVLTEPLGTSIGQADAYGWLMSEGLRQSKVNMAREKLIEARKELYIAADYDEFNTEYNTALAINPNQFTTESLEAFNEALEAANNMKKDYSRTDSNQEIIDRITAALEAARLALVRAADYTQLDEAIGRAVDVITAEGGNISDLFVKYSQDSAQAFIDAFDAAKSVIRGLVNNTANQELINNAYNALDSAIKGLRAAVEAGIEFISNNGLVQNFVKWDTDPFENEIIDPFTFTVNRYITGFDMDPNGIMGGVASADGFIDGVGGATVEIIPNEMGTTSTGATVEVRDAEGTLIYTYTLVAFGDIDGDSIWANDVTELDTDLMINSAEYTWFESYSTPRGLAADINKDGAVTVDDITDLDNACLYIYVINQDFNPDAPGFFI